MHSVELMEHAIATAKRLGWQIRYENLGEVGGGACEIGGKKWIFVDLALSPLDQLEQVLGALHTDAGIYTMNLPECLNDVLGIRRAA